MGEILREHPNGPKVRLESRIADRVDGTGLPRGGATTSGWEAVTGGWLMVPSIH
jgi:hypothetical protein